MMGSSRLTLSWARQASIRTCSRRVAVEEAALSSAESHRSSRTGATMIGVAVETETMAATITTARPGLPATAMVAGIVITRDAVEAKVNPSSSRPVQVVTEEDVVAPETAREATTPKTRRSSSRRASETKCSLVGLTTP